MSSSLSAHNGCVSMFSSCPNWNTWEHRKIGKAKKSRSESRKPPTMKSDIYQKFKRRSEVMFEGGPKSTASELPLTLRIESKYCEYQCLAQLCGCWRPKDPTPEYTKLRLTKNLVQLENSIDDTGCRMRQDMEGLDSWDLLDVSEIQQQHQQRSSPSSYAQVASLSAGWKLSGEDATSALPRLCRKTMKKENYGRRRCEEDGPSMSFKDNQWIEFDSKMWGEQRYRRGRKHTKLDREVGRRSVAAKNRVRNRPNKEVLSAGMCVYS